ncbi:MAG: hypothetical protein CXZ00_10080 [Acidobacteria bacterium]|nr:MAG: hypothetical protein CXZ00_10080 [Acidobacteriota bacterium]
MKRLIGYMAALCLLAITVGCGGISSTGTLAYISNSNGTGFTVYKINTDGTLTLSSVSPQNTPAAPKVIQFSANGRWAYFLDAAGANLYAYTRSGNGELATKIDVYPVTGKASSLVISPNSQFVYVAQPDIKKLAIFSIDQATGILTQVGSSVQIGYAITQLVMSPSGSTVYGLAGEYPAGSGTSQQAVVAWGISTTAGNLLSTTVTSVGVLPSFLVLSVNGSYMYVLDHTAADPVLGPNIYAFTVNGATLTPIAGQGNAAGIFHENPAITTNQDGSTSSTLPSNPVAGVTTNDNRYLYVINQGTHNITTFKIGTGSGSTATGNYLAPGGLSEILGSTTDGTSTFAASPLDCGSGCTTPSFAAVAPQNNALYVLDTFAGKIFQYRINQSTGKLRALSPASVSAESATSDPTWITTR